MRRLVAGVALAFATAVPAAAQVRGLPVYNNGIPKGLGLYAQGAVLTDRLGGGWAAGAVARVGLGRLGVTATGGWYEPSTSAGGPGARGTVMLGGTVNYNLLGGGPLVPFTVTLQGGAGWLEPARTIEGTVQELSVPVGVGIGWTIPGSLAAIKPWLAPRLQFTRVSVPSVGGTRTSAWDESFGLSGGVEVNFLGGLGLHVAGDIPALDESWRAASIAAGLHYQLRIPGL